MLERITFTNHINESMEWGTNGIYVNYNDLHDYAWEYSADNDRIDYFSRGIVTKSIPIVICCDSEAHGLQLKNELLEICDKDVLAQQPGKIAIGDYYLRCYITGSAKSNYLYRKGYLETQLTVVTDQPQWIRETTTVFRPITAYDRAEGKRNFDYNYDFPVDYASSMANKQLNNTGFVPCDFRMVIYGRVVEPAVYIGGHAYKLAWTLEAQEYVIIDSKQKTITLTKRNGEQVNLFNYRDRDSYIFEQIPTGSNPITWDGSFGVDITLIEERSEPKWT